MSATTTNDAARAALELLAVDPLGLGGVWIDARPCRALSLWREAAPKALAPLKTRRLSVAADDDALFARLDLAPSFGPGLAPGLEPGLATGRHAMRDGLLDGEPRALIMPTAERAAPALIGKLALALDRRAISLIALDESEEPAGPAALIDRLAFRLAIDEAEVADAQAFVVDHDRVRAARAAPPTSRTQKGGADEIAIVAARFAIESPRAPLLALRAARCAAALAGRETASQDDLALAAALVLAPRAEAAPADNADSLEPEPSRTMDDPEPADPTQAAALQDRLVEAVRATVPPHVLASLVDRTRTVRAAPGNAAFGARRDGQQGGRPLPSRRGRARDARIDLMATLRAAAPWQTLRRKEGGAGPGAVAIRSDDVRLRRREQRSDRVMVFAVDASGSTALARLAEVKGAIEFLLSEAYVTRDHVSLVAFRGDSAETLLEPTRALARAKRRLAGLAGGGGTPLAAGLAAAMAQIDAATRRGMRATLILLTDGRANIALDGGADRTRAGDDALQMAGALRRRAVPAVLIDAAPRARPETRRFAEALGATYAPLPRADARRLSRAVAEIVHDPP